MESLLKMNILSDLTRRLIMASKNLKIEPKLAPITFRPSIEPSEARTPQILPPMPAHEAFPPSLMIQKQEIRPLSLEDITALTSIPIVKKTSFNLGSIESLTEDNSVSAIICDGPMKPVKIKRDGRLEQTSIMLSRSEIENVIDTFSKKSNIPIKPVFRAQIDNLSILALVSSIESRFMLTLDH